MKKTLKLFGLVALSAFVFSCTKETALDIEKENITPADEQQAETPDTPVIPATDGGLLTSFGVTFEGQQDADTKVSINLGNGETAIEDGDEVLVYVSETNKAVYAYNKAESKFELSEDAPVTLNAPASVFYPAGEFNKETCVFTMPAAVTDLGDLGKKAPMAGQIEVTEGAYTVVLKNLVSVLKVGVTGATTNTLTSVTLAATGKSVAAGAAYTVDFNGTRPVLAPVADDAASSMVVSAGGAALSGEARTFYFLVPAGLSLGDVTVTATLGENHNGGDNTFSISRANFTPEAKKIIGMSFYAGLFSGGAGTDENPYIIANARDFKHISQYCKNGYGSIAAADFLTAKYQQTKDISFGTESRPGNISDYLIAGVVDGTATAFSGTYNGKYNDVQYTLNNFTVNKTPTLIEGKDVEGIALFKKVVDAKLLNIAISNAIIMGGKFTAGLVGHASGTVKIEGCSISYSELSSNVQYGVGGLVGGIYGGAVTECSAANLTIENYSADQSVYGGLISYIGGAVTVSGCTLGAGKIEFKGAEYCGGIVGQSNNENVKIINCVNNSTISSNKYYVGGIVGFLRAGTLDGCGNKGNITGTAGVGGLVGDVGENDTNTPKAYGVITNKCYNTGIITGTGNNVGGIAGVVTAGRIEQSRNTGNITSTGSNVGGIAAQVKVGDVNACYSGYNNTIKGASDVGGIVGLLYPITYKTDANRWLGGTKVINCQSSSYIISTGTDNSGAAGCIVGWARQESGNWGIVIANCTNWGAEGRVKSTNTGSQNLCLGGIVGRLNGGNWAIVDNCFSYTTINAIQINGANLAAGTAAGKAPFQNVGPVFGYKSGTYATIRDCFYRSGWNNSSYLGKIGSTGYENVVQIKVIDNVGKGTAKQEFNLYSGKNATYSAGTLTLLEALNRSAHNINDASTFKEYQTNVNTSNIAYEGWAQPTSGGWLVPSALVALGSGFYKN